MTRNTTHIISFHLMMFMYLKDTQKKSNNNKKNASEGEKKKRRERNKVKFIITFISLFCLISFSRALRSIPNKTHDFLSVYKYEEKNKTDFN